MSPELSVIVPCFNEELNVDELTRRILNVFATGGFEGELILVDDGSQDETRSRIEALERAHPDVVVGKFHTREPGHRRGLADRRGRRARPAGGIDRRRSAVPARGHPAPAPRAATSTSVDIVQGWRSAVGREQGPPLLLLARLQRPAQRDVRHGPAGQQERLRHVRARGVRGPADVPGQLLLLAVVHHGGGARQGLLVQGDRDAVRAAPRRAESFLDKDRRSEPSRAAFVDLGKAAWEYRVRAALRRSWRRSSCVAIPSSTDRTAAIACARPALAGVHGGVRRRRTG